MTTPDPSTSRNGSGQPAMKAVHRWRQSASVITAARIHGAASWYRWTRRITWPARWTTRLASTHASLGPIGHDSSSDSVSVTHADGRGRGAGRMVGTPPAQFKDLPLPGAARAFDSVDPARSTDGPDRTPAVYRACRGRRHRHRAEGRRGTDKVLPPVEQVRPGLWSIPVPIPNNPAPLRARLRPRARRRRRGPGRRRLEHRRGLVGAQRRAGHGRRAASPTSGR